MSFAQDRAIRVVIIGRPNVGKSSLFNRLIGKRRALVHDEPGVTRDRLEHTAKWWVKGKPLPVTLVDTGGLGHERFAEEIRQQVEVSLAEADVVVLLFDGQAGLIPQDLELIRALKQRGLDRAKPILGVVNKVDAEKHEAMAAEFYEAGLDPILTVSAEHGRGIDELQEAVARAAGVDLDADGEPEALESEEEHAALLAQADAEVPAAKPHKVPRIAIVGRPNVGKSTFVNAVVGENRMITSPIAGTTVDAVDSPAELGGKPVLLIDTAGIRRKSKTEQGVEVLSVVQARKALERADVAILLLDGEQGITDQDEKIGGLIEEIGCSVVLAVNKWDTQRGNREFTREAAAERLRKQMAFLRYAPVVFVSAKYRQGFDSLGDLIEEILHQRALKVPTHEFTEWLRREATVHNPANAKFYLCHQSGRHPPTFVCHVNDPGKIHFSLKRHLLNALRSRWGFMGSPVRLLFVEGKNRRSLPKASAAKKTSQGRAKATR